MIYDSLLMLLGFLIHTGLSYSSQRKFKTITMLAYVCQNRVANITSMLAILAFTLIGGDSVAAMVGTWFPVPEGRKIAMFIVGLSLNSILKKLENLTLAHKP